jgi:hypothetical protein
MISCPLDRGSKAGKRKRMADYRLPLGQRQEIELPETIFQFDTRPKTILYLKIFCRLDILSIKGEHLEESKDSSEGTPAGSGGQCPSG